MGYTDEITVKSLKGLVFESIILIFMGRLFTWHEGEQLYLVPGSQPERFIVTVWIQSDSPFDRGDKCHHTTTGSQQLKTIQTIIIKDKCGT